MKYKYTGDEQNLHLPKRNVFVKVKGEIVESEIEINHPDFERVSESEVKRIETQKTEQKEEQEQKETNNL